MNDFEFYAPARILLGREHHKNIGELIKPYAEKVLLHYGGGSIKRSGLYDTVKKSLESAKLAYVELGGVEPNPRLTLAHEGIKLARDEKVDFILAVGGGSVIDSAKAIAMGYYYDGDVWDIYANSLPFEKALPLATVLTIPAAGSESSGDTVITNEKLELKYGYGSPKLRPVLSVINPEFFFTLPKNQVANGIADMMSHVFERYFTNTTHTDLTDGLCETTLRTIMRNAPIVYAKNDDYDAWAEIGFAGTVAHNGLVGMGRDQDWACHNMEHELSAIYDVAHGAGLAVLTPAWMRYVYKDNPDMFVQFAVNVMGVSGSIRDKETIINTAIDKLSAFFVSIGLPKTLEGLGIGSDKLELMAKKCTGAISNDEEPIGGFKKLRWQDVLKIYEAVAR